MYGLWHIVETLVKNVAFLGSNPSSVTYLVVYYFIEVI
jgi:hypothetical protein